MLKIIQKTKPDVLLHPVLKELFKKVICNCANPKCKSLEDKVVQSPIRLQLCQYSANTWSH